MIQSLLSTHFFPITYVTHIPNADMILEIRGDNLPGLYGKQHLTTDAKGFRTTKPIDYDREADYRIFFIGSSTVAQDWIGNRNTISHLVQERLTETLGRDVEVVNTGVSGVRARHSLETMRRVEGYHPDMYVMLMMGNDSLLQIASHFYRETPNQDEAHSRILMKPSEFKLEFVPRAKTYTLENTLLGRALLWLQSLIEASRPAERSQDEEPFHEISYGEFFAEQRGSLFRSDQRTFLPEAVSPSFADALQQIGKFCQESSAECVILTQPNGYKPSISEEYKERLWMTPMFASYSLTLESMSHIARLYTQYWVELGEQWDLPVCDLDSQIEPSLENFYDDVHLNLEGSQRAAAFVHDCLNDVIHSKETPNLHRGSSARSE
ncbi:MAG: SGNH/GDSL hydrolase family protein [bacterium]|nr:SGNH/GDSL hydrolase family protein [bacterium]